MTTPDIDVPIYDHPHWKVILRPSEYDREAVDSLSKCQEIVQKNRVCLRGWDFPHFPMGGDPQLHGLKQGSNWIGAWSHFMGLLEYWRFYQSTQFLHLSTVREAVDLNWRERLAADTIGHLVYRANMQEFDWSSIPGYISLVNFVYRVTEIIEFLKRLVQAEVYQSPVSCTIGLHKIKGFVLTTEPNRLWSTFCQAGEDSLEHVWTISPDELLENSTGTIVEVTKWFFERLGWMEPNEEAIANDAKKLLAGLI